MAIPRAVKPEKTPVSLPAVIKNIGKPVMDSIDFLRVSLTSTQCKRGRPGNPTSCGFALALNESYAQIKSAHVFRTTAFVEYKGRVLRFQVPSSMQRELVALDRNGRMEPGDYWLSPPSPSKKIGQTRSGGVSKKLGKKRPYHFTANIRPSARSPQ